MPYSGDPSTSTADEVRFLLGDTTSTPLLNDQEVDYLVTEHVTALRAAYEGCLVIMARYSGQRDQTIGSTSLTYGAVYDRYRGLSIELGRKGGKTLVSATPWTSFNDADDLNTERPDDWTKPGAPFDWTNKESS